MATGTRAVTADTLGAWLIKARGGIAETDELMRSDFATVTARCVRGTYRTDLVEPGQPVLFWLSGSSRAHPAGIYAQGQTTGRVMTDPTAAQEWVDRDQQGGRPLVMPVRLRPLAAPVLRSDLLAHPSLSTMEVLTMAAGSNPSFVTADHVAALRAAWPQVTLS